MKRNLKKFYEKKKKEIEVAIIIMGIIFLILILRLFIIGGLTAFLVLDGEKAQVWEDNQINHYSWYMGESAKEEYVNKWDMDESIFPDKIRNEMDVIDYKMVYYNPWDEQYLSYLVVEYQETDYERELLRLREYESTPYKGYYGAEGFDKEYTLLAMEADPYYGLIYALATENNKIVYVELIFCNYFMDIDYRNMIDERYLPIGFDATVDNPYRKQKLE